MRASAPPKIIVAPAILPKIGSPRSQIGYAARNPRIAGATTATPIQNQFSPPTRYLLPSGRLRHARDTPSCQEHGDAGGEKTRIRPERTCREHVDEQQPH